MPAARGARAVRPKVELTKRVEAKVTLRDDADGQYDQEFTITPSGESDKSYAVIETCDARMRVSPAEADAIAEAVRAVIETDKQ